MFNKINSKEYWDIRFKQNWSNNHGPEQTKFFGSLAIQHLPLWIRSETLHEKYSICDAGCAEGEFVSSLTRIFPKSHIEGIDFSVEAIKKARKKFPKLKFAVNDVNKLKRSYDVIFSSNTIEHFAEPISIIKNMLNKTRKHLIILTPFEDTGGVLEHEFIFNYASFPLKIRKFILTYVKVIDTNSKNSFWPGKQIIIIYSNFHQINLEKLTAYESTDNSVNQELLRQLNRKTVELRKANSILIPIISSKFYYWWKKYHQVKNLIK